MDWLEPSNTSASAFRPVASGPSSSPSPSFYFYLEVQQRICQSFSPFRQWSLSTRWAACPFSPYSLYFRRITTPSDIGIFRVRWRSVLAPPLRRSFAWLINGLNKYRVASDFGKLFPSCPGESHFRGDSHRFFKLSLTDCHSLLSEAKVTNTIYL